MGQPLLLVSCLVLMWAAGTGCIQVLGPPACFSDYLSVSTCEWRLARPLNCSAQLRLDYWLPFEFFENQTCIPENVADAVCSCHMHTDQPLFGDTFRLDLWAGQQLLWAGSFTPSDYVKPRAPEDVTVHANVSHTWVVKWRNPYPPENLLQNLFYLVNVSELDDPAQVSRAGIRAAQELGNGDLSRGKRKRGERVQARQSHPAVKDPIGYLGAVVCRAWAWLPETGIRTPPVSHQFAIYNVTYTNLELRLSASNLKPELSYRARVRSLSTSLQGTWSEWSPSVTWKSKSLLSLEQQLSRGVGIACLLILLIALVGYLSVVRIKNLWWDQIPNPAHSNLLAVIIQDSQVSLWEKPRTAQERPEGPRWKTCLAKLLPCLLLEHGVEKNQNLPKASRHEPCPGPTRLTWYPTEVHKIVLKHQRESISEVQCVELCQAPAVAEREGEEEEEEEEEEARDECVPAKEDIEGVFQQDVVDRLAESLFLNLLEAPDSMATPGPEGPPASRASQAFNPGPAVVADNPAYRSFSDCCLQSGVQEAPGLEPRDPAVPQAELESWEQILRQQVLQIGAIPASGYRDFSQAVEQGVQAPAGYKALSGVPTSNVSWMPGFHSGGGDYKPCPSPRPGCALEPLLTFESPQATQDESDPHDFPACLGLEPGGQREDGQKPHAAPESPLDDLASGIVYSALTCHQCGRLKQRHSLAERGQGPGVAKPCCDCCSGAGVSPPGSPSPVPLGVSQEGKASLACRPAPNSTLSSGEPPRVAGLACGGTPCVEVA
ncbi:interleukin-4 receptor subunit alpha [Thomomys bottae]